MSGVSRANPETLFLKTKLCRFHQAGKCARGLECKFAHSKQDLQPQPDFSRTKLCPDVRETGRCSRGAACKFAHSVHDLRARTRGHAQLIEDFRALLQSQGKDADLRGAEAPEAIAAPVPQAPVPVPQAPAPTQPVLLQDASQVQGVQVAMMAYPTPWCPAPWCPTVASGAPMCVLVSLGPAGFPPVPAAQEPTVRPVEQPQCDTLGEDFPVHTTVETEPVSFHEDMDLKPSCGKSLGEDDEDDLDMDFPANAWSRQSTEEPTDGPLQEFAGCMDLDEEDPWVAVGEDERCMNSRPLVEFSLEKVASANESALEPGQAALQSVATACGLTFTVKNSFLAFDDNEEPSCQLRRVRSTGALTLGMMV